MFKIKFFVKGSVKKFKNFNYNLKKKNLYDAFLFLQKNKYGKLRRIRDKLKLIINQYYKIYFKNFGDITFDFFVKNFEITGLKIVPSFALKRPFYAAKGKLCIRKKRFSCLVFCFGLLKDQITSGQLNIQLIDKKSKILFH